MFSNFKKALFWRYSFYLLIAGATFFATNSILKNRLDISEKLNSKYANVAVSQAALKLLRDNNGSHIEFDRKQSAFQIMENTAIKDHYSEIERIAKNQSVQLEPIEALKRKKDELNQLDIRPNSSESIYLQNELLHDVILSTQISSLKLDLEISSIEKNVGNLYGLLFFSLGLLLCFIAMNSTSKNSTLKSFKEDPIPA